MQGKTKSLIFLSIGIVCGAGLFVAANYFVHKTSSDQYCMSCHYHKDHDKAWKQSVHYKNGSGTKVGCTDCHLPEAGTFNYYTAKVSEGMKDLWSYYFKFGYDFFEKDNKNGGAIMLKSLLASKDSLFAINKHTGDLDYARGVVYNSACVGCHVNIFPEGISDEGVKAHLYYESNAEKMDDLHCINCHLDAGHYDPSYSHAQNLQATAPETDTIYSEAADVTSFESFDETVPGTGVSFKMIAVPGGTFKMGSPAGEQLRNDDEGPQKTVTVSDFFMAETEVTWNAYFTFYVETMSEGRTPPEKVYAHNSMEDIDAVTGPTPPFGNPDQGWGFGERPALTMTHYGAETFCQWLSLKTGRKYRLPTEAEWEYAARAGTETPYFFDAKPKKLRKDVSLAQDYVIYNLNSRGKTSLPSSVKANPFGLKNMLGNALEYCSDYYAENAYEMLQDGAVDPKGPATGTEYVVRGGSYADGADMIRCASRSHTVHDDWLRTDPQNPKSIWWYSDIKSISFRVVCELPEQIN